MTDNMRESLSALMDNEANELELERVLRGIGEDQELRGAWTRYNAARAALDGESAPAGDMDISGRVRAALEGGNRDARPGLGERLWRPVASLAVAASVAATVVIGGQQLAQVGAPGAEEAQHVATGPSPTGIVNIQGAVPIHAKYGTEGVPTLDTATGIGYRKLAEQRMGRYMQEHAEHAALNSPQGLIPFARVPRIQE